MTINGDFAYLSKSLKINGNMVVLRSILDVVNNLCIIQFTATFTAVKMNIFK